jgi:hypothetical protein
MRHFGELSWRITLTAVLLTVPAARVSAEFDLPLPLPLPSEPIAVTVRPTEEIALFPEWLAPKAGSLETEKTLSRTQSGTFFEQLLRPLSADDSESERLPELALPELAEGPRVSVWDDLMRRREPGWTKRIQTWRTEWGKARARLELPDTVDFNQPQFTQHWRAEELVSVPLPVDSFFVFGQVVGRGNSFVNQQARVSTKTGIGWKWVPLPKTELMIRGGPLVTYENAINAAGTQRSQMAIEVLAEAPLYGPWRIEYFGSATPALVTTDRDIISNDLRIAMPIRKDGEVYIGATYRWENAIVPVTSSWVDRAGIYFGLELRH